MTWRSEELDGNKEFLANLAARHLDVAFNAFVHLRDIREQICTEFLTKVATNFGLNNSEYKELSTRVDTQLQKLLSEESELSLTPSSVKASNSPASYSDSDHSGHLESEPESLGEEEHTAPFRRRAATPLPSMRTSSPEIDERMAATLREVSPDILDGLTSLSPASTSTGNSGLPSNRNTANNRSP